jgi:hypothetical protein
MRDTDKGLIELATQIVETIYKRSAAELDPAECRRLLGLGTSHVPLSTALELARECGKIGAHATEAITCDGSIYAEYLASYCLQVQGRWWNSPHPAYVLNAARLLGQRDALTLGGSRHDARPYRTIKDVISAVDAMFDGDAPRIKADDAGVTPPEPAG